MKFNYQIDQVLIPWFRISCYTHSFDLYRALQNFAFKTFHYWKFQCPLYFCQYHPSVQKLTSIVIFILIQTTVRFPSICQISCKLAVHTAYKFKNKTVFQQFFVTTFIHRWEMPFSMNCIHYVGLLSWTVCDDK